MCPGSWEASPPALGSAPAPLAGVNFAPADRTTVSEDHSLEEFASTDSAETDDTDDVTDEDADSAQPVDDAVESPDDAVDPVDPTYDFSPDGAACGACGERATRRWHADGDYVCADCKEW